ncbi:hypothetical protein Droror1_Dr00013560 [Drosera rotundifolia]
MMMTYKFNEEEFAVDETLGYPIAYAKLCKDRDLGLYSHGPPMKFDPYGLTEREASRARELEEMFPIIDPQAKPTTKPSIFVSLLWKQLNHLGNAGFDPALFRVDPYGNVLYYHADLASPLAWDIDHWFPCSRGGLTLPRNLRILQWQICERKHNKLEMLVPWWDMQLGISINQFLSIFAASNSDFRKRAFSFLFANGEDEELKDWLTVDSHSFPQHFMESQEQLGLAPAALVLTRRESRRDSITLQSIDINRQGRPSTPIIAAMKSKHGVLKENQEPEMATNPHQVIAMARNSLKQREETVRMKAELQKLDEEMTELKNKNEEEKVTIEELERVLSKRRRKAEKCRVLAEAQSSYRITLEKMIRDAMHQSVVYKQQARLNQAATSALMATLEAQRALCDSAEKELYKKYKQRDDLELQVNPELEQGRKRSRGTDAILEELDSTAIPSSSNLKLRKELRAFLEEEEAKEAQKLQLVKTVIKDQGENCELHETGEVKDLKFRFPIVGCEIEEDEECKRERGKGNIEKWLQMLLDNTLDGDEPYTEQVQDSPATNKKINEKYVRKENVVFQQSPYREHKENNQPKFHEKDDMMKKDPTEGIKAKDRSWSTPRRQKPMPTYAQNESISDFGRSEIKAKDRSWSTPRRQMPMPTYAQNESISDFGRSDSARPLRRIPSSPSTILGMKKKQPVIVDDYRHGNKDQLAANKSASRPLSPSRQFIKSSIKSIKKVVKI